MISRPGPAMTDSCHQGAVVEKMGSRPLRGSVPRVRLRLEAQPGPGRRVGSGGTRRLRQAAGGRHRPGKAPGPGLDRRGLRQSRDWQPAYVGRTPGRRLPGGRPRSADA